jgi:hypothetical protein
MTTSQLSEKSELSPPCTAPVVPYKGGPCPRPGCDGTVLMGVVGHGTRLRCLCGWEEEQK